MRQALGKLALLIVVLFVCFVPKAADAFSSRQLIDQTVREFKLLQSLPAGVSFPDECCIVYVLGTDQNLWREDYSTPDANGSGIGHRTQVDSLAIDFQPWDGTVVYVLGFDHKLWREVGNWTNRTLIDQNVASFQVIDGRFIYVLGLDGNLWLEEVNQFNRAQVASGVKKFQPFNNGTATWSIYVLYQTTNLFYAAQDLVLLQFTVDSATTNSQISVNLTGIPPAINGNVLDFNAVDLTTQYILGTDGKLWNERGSASNRDLVDSSVLSFLPLNNKEVLVLGTDRKLWRELGNEFTRDNVDITVFVDTANPQVPYYAWADVGTGWPNIWVMGWDRNLWDEGMATAVPMNPTPCTPQGVVPTDGVPCCGNMNTVNVNSCQPPDGPAECGHPALPDEHCCRHSTPCVGNTTCVIEPGSSDPYCVINTVPPTAQSPMQSGGGLIAPLHDCLMWCAEAVINNTMNGVEYGQFANSQLAESAANAQWSVDDCDACCGAECAASEFFANYVSLCNSAARGGVGPDGICE